MREQEGEEEKYTETEKVKEKRGNEVSEKATTIFFFFFIILTVISLPLSAFPLLLSL